MNRFMLIGTYNEYETTAHIEGALEIVKVPLVTEQGSFCYGIGKVTNTMLSYGICPTENGIDMMAFATLVYLADTRISRNLHSQDSWTREITIRLPVIDVANWKDADEDIQRMLNFLTGDKWSVEFELRKRRFDDLILKVGEKKSFDVVSLFSGGMDSLISTIDYLEQNKNLLLISHAGDGFTKNAQTNILEVLEEKYSEIIPIQLDLWMVFDKEFIPNSEPENTTRSRSFLFIAFAIFAISGMHGIRKLEVPENGLIALNVPLDNLRVGSHSTRTTHPFYLGMWNNILDKLGFTITVENPYWDKTKGEMADQCKNKKLIYELMPKSVSCSSPGKARWDGLPPQHCGFCVPCLIRRAAMQKAFGFGKDNTEYTKNEVNEILQNHENATGVQLRSFQFAINRIKKQPSIAKILIHKPGPLPNDVPYLEHLAGVYSRGLLEVDDFIRESLINEVEE